MALAAGTTGKSVKTISVSGSLLKILVIKLVIFSVFLLITLFSEDSGLLIKLQRKNKPAVGVFPLIS